ncbi:MAG: hypothetical protein WCC06_10410 [Candidatus Aminicenantales bacterium]
MPVKTKAKKVAKAGPKKKVTRPRRRVKAAPKVKKGSVYECKVCGYRLVVDRACGCVHEHVFVCCKKPMKKVVRKKRK